jgi:hypothetical protein
MFAQIIEAVLEKERERGERREKTFGRRAEQADGLYMRNNDC